METSSNTDTELSIDHGLVPKKTILVVWNQGEEDIYEVLRAAINRRTLRLNPEMSSTEPTVAGEISTICAALRAGPYEVVSVDIRDDVRRLLNAVRTHQPDVVVNLVECFYDEEVLQPNVAALFELLDLPYTGNTPHTLSTCQRRVTTRRLLENAGLPVAPYFVEHVGGRQICAAVLGNATPEVLALFDTSDDGPEAVMAVRGISPELEDELETLAFDAYRAMDCRDYACINMYLGEDGHPYILDIIPNPDLAAGSVFVQCAEASGRSHATTLAEIVALAHRRAHVPDELAMQSTTDFTTPSFARVPAPTESIASKNLASRRGNRRSLQ